MQAPVLSLAMFLLPLAFLTNNKLDTSSPNHIPYILYTITL